MRTVALRWFKQSPMELSVRVSAPHLHQIQMVLKYVKLGRWMRDNGFRTTSCASDHEAVFDEMAAQVAAQRVAHLEFGVFKGASMRSWSRRLTHPDSCLHGFDSFEGLPEDFDVGGPYHKRRFDARGEVPQMEDPRIRFYKGWVRGHVA